ncbi:unnamed protein product [Caenorhabditis sp. 36 PRJEB53466]|nr:unnamed protein product [Caenorhabditis sp. 36 PRJEB53466]
MSGPWGLGWMPGNAANQGLLVEAPQAIFFPPAATHDAWCNELIAMQSAQHFSQLLQQQQQLIQGITALTAAPPPPPPPPPPVHFPYQPAVAATEAQVVHGLKAELFHAQSNENALLRELGEVKQQLAELKERHENESDLRDEVEKEIEDLKIDMDYMRVQMKREKETSKRYKEHIEKIKKERDEAREALAKTTPQKARKRVHVEKKENVKKEEEKEETKKAKFDMPLCDICRFEYGEHPDRTPRVLKCGHTVCEECCTNLADGLMHLQCPFDRKETAMTENGTVDLPKNYVLIQMLSQKNN